MKATIILVVVIVVVGLLWIRTSHTPASAPTAAYHEAAYHSNYFYHTAYLHLEPASDRYRYNDLQLYPIFASEAFLHHHQRLGPYLSLQEALDQHKIVITELTSENAQAPDGTTDRLDEAEVNRLFADNISADTIIILGGEVVQGGKQDRMIAEDFVVFPHSGKIDIDVYCVEHGRWTPSDGHQVLFETMLDVAPSKVRKAARAPESQAKVWEEVEVLHEELDIASSTGALAYAVGDVKMKESVQPYKEALQHIRWPENVVGVVAIRGGELVGIDIFAQYSLFAKYYASLLSSYCSDVYEESDNTLLPYTEVQALLRDVISSEEALERRINEQGTQLKHGKYRLHVAAY